MCRVSESSSAAAREKSGWSCSRPVWRELKLDQADYEWYLDLRRFGGVRHCGFGLGFERLIMYFNRG